MDFRFYIEKYINWKEKHLFFYMTLNDSNSYWTLLYGCSAADGLLFIILLMLLMKMFQFRKIIKCCSWVPEHGILSHVYTLEVYRMWDFQYSRIRMRILHFNIRGYRMRMRILYILLY